MEEKSWKQGRVEARFEWGQGPEGIVAPYIDWLNRNTRAILSFVLWNAIEVGDSYSPTVQGHGDSAEHTSVLFYLQIIEERQCSLASRSAADMLESLETVRDLGAK
jgi:hypothetical protein